MAVTDGNQKHSRTRLKRMPVMQAERNPVTYHSNEAFGIVPFIS